MESKRTAPPCLPGGVRSDPLSSARRPRQPSSTDRPAPKPPTEAPAATRAAARPISAAKAEPPARRHAADATDSLTRLASGPLAPNTPGAARPQPCAGTPHHPVSPPPLPRGERAGVRGEGRRVGSTRTSPHRAQHTSGAAKRQQMRTSPNRPTKTTPTGRTQTIQAPRKRFNPRLARLRLRPTSHDFAALQTKLDSSASIWCPQAI